MHEVQNCTILGNDDEERIQSLMQKTKEEYIRLGKTMICLVLEASRRIEGYTDEIIELKQKREEKKMKKRVLFGILALIMGFLFLLLGIFTFMNPNFALTTFVYVYGIAAIVGGVLGIIFYATLEHRTGFGPVSSLISGILNILLGILLVSNVWAGRFALTFLFPFWFIFLCISRLCNLGYIRRYAGNGEYWLTLIVNVLGLLLGFGLLINPFASLLTLTYLIGFYLIMAGVEMIVFAFGHFKHRD